MLVISRPPLPLGPQPHVDLVQAPGRRMHRQQVHQPLREAHEEHLVVDAARPFGLLLRAARVVQEHQIEIRAVAELHAAELAVADHAESHGAARCRPRRTSACRAAA